MALDRALRPWLGPWERAGIVAVFAFSPAVRRLLEVIGSEAPFVLFLSLVLGAIERHLARPERSRGEMAAAGALTGVCVYLAFAARFLGVLLLPALVVVEWIRWRRISAFTIAAGVTAAVGAGVQSLFFGSDTSYFDQLSGLAAALVRNVGIYGSALTEFFENGGSWRLPAWALTGLLAVTAGWGYVRSLMERITVFHVFLPLYLAVILLWPAAQNFRFLFPIMPVVLLFAVKGLSGQRVVLAVLAGVVLVSHAAGWIRLPYGPVEEGVGTAEFQSVAAFVRESTPAEARILFRKPRAMALYTKRAAGSYQLGPPEEIWTFMETNGIRYIVRGGGQEDDPVYLDPVLELYEDRLRLVYDQDGYRVWEKTDPPA